ncbi:hypothetical protein D3C87_1375570 [compost metagenome]
MNPVSQIEPLRRKKQFDSAVDAIKVAFTDHLLQSINSGTKPLKTRSTIEAAIPDGFKVKYFRAILTPTSARITFQGSTREVTKPVVITFTWS